MPLQSRQAGSGGRALFDLRKVNGELIWHERLCTRDEEVAGKVVHVVGC
jgi:hypothetical protein